MEPIVVFPVVHMTSVHHAVEQAGVAENAGAQGVFLINHGGSWQDLAKAARAVKDTYGYFVGVNALDLNAVEVFDKLTSKVAVDGVWADNAGIDETTTWQGFASAVDAARMGFSGLYFGGVAFKYQRPVTDLAGAAQLAAVHMDVVCTSGPGTGQTVDGDKVATMAKASTKPIAVASGVSVENLAALADAGARYFLASTSISASWTALDLGRARELLTLANHINTTNSLPAPSAGGN